MSNDQAYIEIRGLKKSYGNIHALSGLDLVIPRGCIFGVVGPNGAGKTTLFSILCGFIQPTAGEVRVQGTPIEIGTVLPISLATFPQDSAMMPIQIKRSLIYYATLDGINDKESARKRAGKVLHEVKLPEVWERVPRTLSHGMRKRVGIAQAFIVEHDLLIFDEPLAGLDPVSSRNIRMLIRKAAVNRTVLISSHDLDQVQDLCSEVAILDRGKVVRVEAMENLVKIGGEITFKVPKKPDDSVIEAVGDLDFVDEALWDAPDSRLRIYFDGNATSPEDASTALVQLLAGNGVVFTEMQLGRRLEDVVREETS